MATRNEKLNRLRIASPCTESWDGMSGDAVRRHCARCDRQVFDFARMTPRQIEARVEASGGRLCARITRGSDGGLVTRPAPEPPSFWREWSERRASPVAAALVAALLALRGEAAETPGGEARETTAAPEPDRPESGSSKPGAAPSRELSAKVVGAVHDEEGAPLPGASVVLRDGRTGMEISAVTGADGRYLFDDLAPGTYSLAIGLEGFDPILHQDISVTAGRATTAEVTLPIVQGVAGGIMAPADESLRQAFGESDLVVTGVVAATAAIDPQDPSEVEIEIRVTSVLKGRHAGRSLFVDRAEGEGSDRLAPGTKVLAFLDAGDPRPGRRTVYVAAGWKHGLEALPNDELAAYAERLEALERISRRGDPQPEDLAEWLVSTAEEPLTRKEAILDFAQALSSLDALAEEKNLSLEPAASDLRAEVEERLADGAPYEGGKALDMAGAYFSEPDMHRLTRALLATRGITAGDFGLYQIVLRWAADEANEWLLREFRQTEPIDDIVGRAVMDRLAEELDSASLKALLEEADAKGEALFEEPTEEDWDEARKRIEAELSGAQKELRIRFREMLGE